VYSDWGKVARADIHKIMAAMPEDATLGDRRKALKRHASEFHGGTSWGKKVWPRECRKYLERHHGLEPLSDAGRNPPRTTQGRKLAAGIRQHDIIFPFREGSDVSIREGRLPEKGGG
jgi:hypothetical protein